MQRSEEFRLPDISLCSLDALLQTVTQKLGRKRKGGDDAPRRRVQSDRVLVSINERRFRDTSVWQKCGNPSDFHIGHIGPGIPDFARVPVCGALSQSKHLDVAAKQ